MSLLAKSVFAAAAMFVGLGSVASADVVVQKAPGGVGTDDIFVAEGLWRDVTISSPAGIGTIGVGLYKLERSMNGAPFIALSTFCMEVDQFIDLPATYAVSLLSDALTVGKAEAISRLWALRFADASSTASTEFDGVAGADSKDRAAAFQLALWEIQLDGTGGTLATGNFQIGAGNLAETDLVSLVNIYLAHAALASNPLASISALTSADSQDLIIPGNPPSPVDDPVPAPASLALLAGALAGLAALRRRRNA